LAWLLEAPARRRRHASSSRPARVRQRSWCGVPADSAFTVPGLEGEHHIAVGLLDAANRATTETYPCSSPGRRTWPRDRRTGLGQAGPPAMERQPDQPSV